MNEVLDALSVWTTTRASGITSYLFLFLSTVAGITIGSRLIKNKAKPIVLTLHQSAGWFGFLFGMMHGAVLLFDKYVGYSVSGLLIPFTAESHPVLTGIGTLSFYMTFIVILSSDLMKKLGKKVWKMTHMLAFPGYFLALLHGLLIGSDSSYPWAEAMYGATGIIVVALTVYRVWTVKKGNREAPKSGRVTYPNAKPIIMEPSEYKVR
ncbi:ferric reductase [Paenibacillus sp. MMO-177]|uniref:ferric reductase n=1 Tax=Paenibacillus sp. MMO-177 TaxID=3081289 RepID=UPI003017D1A7